MVVNGRGKRQSIIHPEKAATLCFQFSIPPAGKPLREQDKPSETLR